MKRHYMHYVGQKEEHIHKEGGLECGEEFSQSEVQGVL